jgi:hypothetical protein
MLISNKHDEELLNIPFTIRRSDNVTYYMKYRFDNEKKEYLLLVTDLCLVWFEHGDFTRLKHNAEKELNMEVKTSEAAYNLLQKIQLAFEENATRCQLVREKGHVKVHLPLDRQQKTEITVLNWIFDCRQLDQEANVDEQGGWKTGPQVIFHHFIVPSQTIVNYFTENVLGKKKGYLCFLGLDGVLIFFGGFYLHTR